MPRSRITGSTSTPSVADIEDDREEGLGLGLDAPSDERPPLNFVDILNGTVPDQQDPDYPRFVDILNGTTRPRVSNFPLVSDLLNPDYMPSTPQDLVLVHELLKDAPRPV
ncbi:MAG: hypothetical protein AAFN74_21705, partial [Myxococcota bacterium]